MFCNWLSGENPSQVPRFWPQFLFVYPLSSQKMCWVSLFPGSTTGCCCSCPNMSRALPIAGGLQHKPHGMSCSCWEHVSALLCSLPCKMESDPSTCLQRQGARSLGKGTERELHVPGTSAGTKCNGEVSREGDEN